MQGYTKGALTLHDVAPTDQAFFYYPHTNDPFDFREPAVFAVTRIATALEVILSDHWTKGVTLPEGVEITPVQIMKEYAEQLIATGQAERPLVDQAKTYMADNGVYETLLLYAVSSPPGHHQINGTLIDGTHRYVAAAELGIPKLVAIFLREQFLWQFRIGGVPFDQVKRALGSGPEETGRFEFEKRRGYRNADGSLKL